MANAEKYSQSGRGRFLQRGAATSPVAYNGPPKMYYFALLPKLTMLALASAIEPLRIANQIARVELYNWFTMTTGGQPIACSNGLKVIPDHALVKVPRDARIFICAGVEPHRTLDPKLTAWVRRQNRMGSQIGAICTGAFTLAQAGLLSHKRFTLHWENQASFIEAFPDLLPTKNLFENGANLMTAAGGSAATDMMLHIIESDFGRAFAAMVSDMCLHGRSQAGTARQRSSKSSIFECRNPALINAVLLMQENLEEPLDMEEIAGYAEVSRRQLERNFKTYLNVSPRKYYTDIRLSHAYALLGETDMSVTDVTAATGFNSISNFSKLFREKFDISPTYFRKSWVSSIDPDLNSAAPKEPVF